MSMTSRGTLVIFVGAIKPLGSRSFTPEIPRIDGRRTTAKEGHDNIAFEVPSIETRYSSREDAICACKAIALRGVLEAAERGMYTMPTTIKFRQLCPRKLRSRKGAIVKAWTPPAF